MKILLHRSKNRWSVVELYRVTERYIFLWFSLYLTNKHSPPSAFLFIYSHMSFNSEREPICKAVHAIQTKHTNKL